MGLAAYCNDLLDSAELRVRQVDAAAAAAEAGDTGANGYDLHEEIDRLLFDDGDDEA